MSCLRGVPFNHVENTCKTFLPAFLRFLFVLKIFFDINTTAATILFLLYTQFILPSPSALGSFLCLLFGFEQHFFPPQPVRLFINHHFLSLDFTQKLCVCSHRGHQAGNPMVSGTKSSIKFEKFIENFDFKVSQS